MTDDLFKLEAREQPGKPIVEEVKPDPCSMIIFGVSGDLTERMLIPALYGLVQEDSIPESFYVVGYSRSIDSSEELRAVLGKAVEDHLKGKGKEFDPKIWNRLKERLHAVSGGYDEEEDFKRLRKKLEELDEQFGNPGNRLAYLATPAKTFRPVLETLSQSGIVERQRPGQDGPWQRVVIEKPFGHDLPSAQELNQFVTSLYDESQIYRIDHFLGKETVQNILVLRFGNTIFEPLWNRNYISHVEITAAETLGMEGRGRFYDQTGVLRDLIQNHLLQVMALCAMEQPINFGADGIRDEKLKVFRSIRPLWAETVDNNVVYGQYDGYLDEEGVDPDSRTPTYMAVRLEVDNWRWHGVPFYLRSGKRLKAKQTEIAIHFQPVPLCLFGRDEICQRLEPNILVMRIAPEEGVRLSMVAKVPGADLSVGSVTMDFNYEEVFRRASTDAYQRLILDGMRGDQTLFARRDEVEEAWHVMNPIIEAHEGKGKIPVHSYEPDSSGPAEADQMLRRNNHSWRPLG